MDSYMSGFSGLSYNATDTSLVSFSGGYSWYLPCGQTKLHRGGIPVSDINAKVVSADVLRLYAIVG